MSGRLIGRGEIVDKLVAHLAEGHAVVAYGPRGIGGSAILDATAKHFIDRPIIRLERLDSLPSLVAALADVYRVQARSNVLARAGALAGAARKPGVLLVDRVIAASAPVRNCVRELGATGTGAVILGVVEHANEHAKLRGFRLAHRELEIPTLARNQLLAVLEAEIGRKAHRLLPDERERLIAAASGRPGLLARMGQRLADARYWRDGHVLVELLRIDVVSSMLEPLG